MHKRFHSVFFSLLAAFILPITLWGQGYEYTLSWDQPHSHLYQVSLKTAPAEGDHTDFQIPAWRPGRYIEQRYAAGISGFEATDDKGKKLQWKKTGRDTWQVNNPGKGAIAIRYRFYANEMDAGSSMLNAEMAYFNGANLFMHVRDRCDAPCVISFPSMPQNWMAATSLKKNAAGQFTAETYHDFVDAPTILSASLKQFSMQVDQCTFWFHFQGKFSGGKEVEDTLMKQTAKIIRAQAAVFGEIPMTEYHFIFHLLPYNFRHAVEHAHSACFTLPETVSKDVNTIAGAYGIISHEFFHLWNVKRLRPAALWPYDYQNIPFTTLHWFTEGVTDYYTDLTMLRAGVISREQYFNNLGGSLAALENNYAAREISPALASFDSWLSGSDYADPHRQISYYPLGERVGLLLDLELRKTSGGEVSLDDLMKYLYQTYYKQNLGLPEDGILRAAEKLTGKKFDNFFEQYVSGTAAVDYKDLFKPFGITCAFSENANATWAKIGIDRMDKVSGGLVSSSVRPGGEAELAGLGDGDLIIEIEGKPADKFNEKEFFAALAVNDEIDLKVLHRTGAAELRIIHKGKDLPKTCAIKADEKMSEKEKQRLDAWLGMK